MYLSLCLIAKNENTYLPEWLDYHILQGVEHFWIYDNESSTPLAETLAEYVAAGWVTVHTISGRAMQLFAYDACLQTYGSLSRWIGFIDTDEFIVPRSGQPLNEFLKSYEAYGGLALSSLFFGHGGNRLRPAGGQIAAYRRRAPDAFSYSRLIKSIVQPARVIYPLSPHSFLYKEGFFCVNADEKRVDAQEFPCHSGKIQLNHYFTRSEEEWNQKLSRGRGDSGIPYKDERGTKVNRYASVEDDAIIEHLRARLSREGEDAKTWAKQMRPDSTFLTDRLHQAAHGQSPAVIETRGPVEVFPRRELIDYYEEAALGLRLFEEGQFPQARRFWEGQIEKYPFDPICYTNFADVCLRLGDFPAAWDALAQAWRIAPQSLYVLLGMTDYFYVTGNYAQAEKTSLLSASLGGLQPEGLALLAISQWKQGKQEEARATAQPVLAHMTPGESRHPLFKELARLMSA